MNKLTQILIAVLILQICLAAVTRTDLFSGNKGGADSSTILKADLSKVDLIKIEEKGAEALSLKKVDAADKWILPAKMNFPAASSAVEELKKKFVAMKGVWPVATTGDAAKRFKVDKEEFEKKLSFLSGDKPVAEIYIGTAPSFRKRHIRVEGESDIYSVDLNPYDLSTKLRDWIDKSAYTLDADEVSKLVTPQFTLLRKNGKWELQGVNADQVTNQIKAKETFNNFCGIVFQEIQGDKDDPEFGLAQPEVKYTVVLKDGKEVEFKLGRRTVNDGFILKTSDKPYYVSVSSYVIDNIKKSNRDELIASKSEKKETAKEAKVGEN